jgi:hypothetical protein
MPIWNSIGVEDIAFGDGFGCISSPNVGPAGYLYVITVLVSLLQAHMDGLTFRLAIMIKSHHYFDNNSRILPPAMLDNTIEPDVEMINQRRYSSCCVMIFKHKIANKIDQN